MNIILISNRYSSALNLGTGPMVALVASLALLAGGMGLAVGMSLSGSSPKQLWPLIKPVRQAELDAMAVRLGELQARLIRLNGLAQQVGTKAGIDVKPFASDAPVPRGGMEAHGHAMSAAELLRQLGSTESGVGNMYDQFNLAETILLRPSSTTLPTLAPLTSGLQSSSFGWRIDPFNGHQAFHEGLDFVGAVGTPIKAAGAGTVVYAGFHPQYGNMVEIDHGNNLTSRYAHASKLLVKVGDHVEAGQVVSEIGSTGRSTGPHLHFEIRYRGVAQNPLRFLAQNTQNNVGTVASTEGPHD
ncbi:murein DD-endopeptidase MepM/ murein hydrolase activator NlpD [Silvimonas terrae]|uniref:Murein DD-endopeptidase MepM/ murein hydrolase activator NlpD n=1 Tax=Silvimonas terrae TaxID=300266 RepID=A0A840RHT6_9NEIS|nr:M23 family metallopeptidase [Silvimonas terrae]MBB5193209.1 murein DD-endopeptidase MepM/ murein hydrolase activator NlpD [Silvimonas terrae]